MNGIKINNAKELLAWFKAVEHKEDSLPAGSFRLASENPNVYDLSTYPVKMVVDAIGSLPAEQLARFQFVRNEEYGYAVDLDKILITVPNKCKIKRIEDGHHIPFEEIEDGSYRTSLAAFTRDSKKPFDAMDNESKRGY